MPSHVEDVILSLCTLFLPASRSSDSSVVVGTDAVAVTCWMNVGAGFFRKTDQHLAHGLSKGIKVMQSGGSRGFVPCDHRLTQRGLLSVLHSKTPFSRAYFLSPFACVFDTAIFIRGIFLCISSLYASFLFVRCPFSVVVLHIRMKKSCSWSALGV